MNYNLLLLEIPDFDQALRKVRGRVVCVYPSSGCEVGDGEDSQTLQLHHQMSTVALPSLLKKIEHLYSKVYEMLVDSQTPLGYQNRIKR